MKTFRVYWRGTSNFEIIHAISSKSAKMIMAQKHSLSTIIYLRTELLKG